MQIAARRAFLTQDHRLALVWRLLSYLFLFLVVNLVANVARGVLESLGVPSVLGRLVFTLLYISGTLGLTYGYRRFIDRRSWQGIALPPLHKHLRDITVGVVFAMLMVALVFSLESAAGWIQVVGSEGGTGALTLLVDSLLVSLGFSVCEEICFRGYLFQNLGEGQPISMATLITGVIFGVFHLLGGVGFDVPGLSFLLLILLLNVFLVLTRLLTRSLWLAIGFHTVFDWLAIIVGLGVVVQYDRHLLHLTRTASVSVEYLLSLVVVILGILLLLVWARLRNHYLSWHSTLTEEGQLQAPEAQPSTVGQAGTASGSKAMEGSHEV
jgi:membrane protease YdiL (CAAX protease family)